MDEAGQGVCISVVSDAGVGDLRDTWLQSIQFRLGTDASLGGSAIEALSVSWLPTPARDEVGQIV